MNYWKQGLIVRRPALGVKRAGVQRTARLGPPEGEVLENDRCHFPTTGRSVLSAQAQEMMMRMTRTKGEADAAGSVMV